MSTLSGSVDDVALGQRLRFAGAPQGHGVLVNGDIEGLGVDAGHLRAEDGLLGVGPHVDQRIVGLRGGEAEGTDGAAEIGLRTPHL